MGKGTAYPHIVRLLNKHYKGGRVLELGAGAAQYKSYFDHHIGIDLPNNRFSDWKDIDVYADAAKLPFAPKTFDFVFVVGALYMMNDPRAVLQEAWTILKPKGTLLVFDYMEHIQVKAVFNNLARGKRTNFALWNSYELRRLIAHSAFSEIRQLRAHSIFYDVARLLAGRKPRWLIMKAHKQ